jgi:hypothetical protein
MSRGRPQTTGRFETRAELEYEVLWRWKETPSHISDIAKACKVSTTTVDNIIMKDSK